MLEENKVYGRRFEKYKLICIRMIYICIKENLNYLKNNEVTIRHVYKKYIL